MKLSDRISNLLPDGDDGWEIYRRACDLRDAGEQVTMLTIGEHDIPTAPSILDAMDRAARDGDTGYAPVPGHQKLREAVAERLAERTGVATSWRNVLITPGGQAALFAAHMAALDPGDAALIVDPYYATYPGTVRSAGGVPRAIATRSRDGFRPTEAALEAVAAGAKSLLINSPNNPTGQVYGRETLEVISAVCKRHDLWLISDEVYDTQIWSGAHLSPRALPGMSERTLVVGSMSKSHAMTGSRIGWLVGPEEVVEHLSNLATNTTYGVPGFVQMAAHWGLGQGEPLEEAISAPFKRRRDIAREALGETNRVTALPSDATMYLMLDIRPTGLSGTEFAEALLERERIAVMPGESFGASAAGHIRVALTVDDARFADAIHRLAAFAEAVTQTPELTRERA